jgi:hypothetical protein
MNNDVALESPPRLVAMAAVRGNKKKKKKLVTQLATL